MFPWAPLPAHSSVTHYEFLDQLRANLIHFGAKPQTIDCVDALYSIADQEHEIDELNEKLDTAEEQINELKERYAEVKTLRRRTLQRIIVNAETVDYGVQLIR